eukprot:2076187-Amphidinium_carterae.1
MSMSTQHKSRHLQSKALASSNLLWFVNKPCKICRPCSARIRFSFCCCTAWDCVLASHEASWLHHLRQRLRELRRRCRTTAFKIVVAVA